MASRRSTDILQGGRCQQAFQNEERGEDPAIIRSIRCQAGRLAYFQAQESDKEFANVLDVLGLNIMQSVPCMLSDGVPEIQLYQIDVWFGGSPRRVQYLVRRRVDH